MIIPLIIDKNGLEIEELFRVSWDEAGGLQKLLTGPPMTSIRDDHNRDMEPVTAPYRFRVSEQGNKIAILCNDPIFVPGKFGNLEFLLYDTQNKRISKTAVPLNDSRFEKLEIIDFLIDENSMLYLLSRFYTKEKTITNRLQLVTPGGTPAWEIEWDTGAGITVRNDSLSGKCTAIIKATENHLLIQSEEAGKTAIFKINIKTGNAERWGSIDNTDLKIFADDKLSMRYISFIKEANNRAYIEYNPEKDKKLIKYAGPEIYAALAFPVAIDIHNNIYCVEGFSLSCIGSALHLKWVLPVNNIIPGSGYLLASLYNENAKDLIIYKWGANGTLAETTHVNLNMPGIRLGRLLGLTNADDFVIETYRENNKQVLLYNRATEKLEELSAKTLTKKFRLQAAATWQVDKMGNIYLPVAGDEALHIIKIAEPL